MPQSVYIHIPFCKSKCYYCSFVSYTQLELKEKYLNALEQEIYTNYKGEELKTLYFGGGTPSLLRAEEFKRIINLLNISPDTEITTELNPDSAVSADGNYLIELCSAGINRISLGCQTFNNQILKEINRRHNAQQVVDAVEYAKKAGFKNISLDFIYGLPSQTPRMFLEDLQKALGLGISHISLYGLAIEKGCYFYTHKISLPNDDIQAQMYLAAVNFLTSRGFEHYEISNFSLPGYNSKHNLTYWNNEEYYGFGAAAHGYKNGIRYGNQEVLKDYINNPGMPLQTRIETTQDKLEEEIFLGFRKMSGGIDKNLINKKYNIDFDIKYRRILDKYLQLKLLVKTSCGYALTPQGALVSNTILCEFLD